MLKKITALLLSALLLVSTTGIRISKHYCGHQLVSVDIGEGLESCCDKKDGEKGNCCHNDSEYHQLDTDYILSITLQLEHPIIIVHPEFGVPIYEANQAYPKDDIIVFNDLPPPKLKVRLSKLQTYLICF